MPSSYTTWRCDRCRKTHFSYDEAQKCETDHIVTDAVASLKADLDRIFSGQPKRKASRP